MSPVSSASGDEIPRRDYAALRVLPAQERFRAAKAPGVEVDLGLIAKNEFSALERAPQLALELEALGHALLAICRRDWTLLRPARLAEYMAASALVISAWASSPCCGKMLMPTLEVMKISRFRMRKGRFSASTSLAGTAAASSGAASAFSRTIDASRGARHRTSRCA